MYLTLALTTLVATVAQVTVGWHIPDGAKDGIYHVKVYKNGTEHHDRICDLPVTINATVRVSHVDASQYDISCYGDESKALLDDHHITDLANAAIDKECGNGKFMGSGMSFYAISQCAVAYVCNHGSGFPVGECSAGERAFTSKLITDKCGEYTPGSANYTKGFIRHGPTLSIAYGYESHCGAEKAKDFCA